MNIKQIADDGNAYSKMLEIRGDICTSLSRAIGKNIDSNFYFIDTDGIADTRKLFKKAEAFFVRLEKEAAE